tara:strand:+ start:142 stop:321 length:180 start_codon:yes stop_codon:yes gene_type:complete
LEDTQKKLNSSEFREANTGALIQEAVEFENQNHNDDNPTQSQADDNQMIAARSKHPEMR